MLIYQQKLKAYARDLRTNMTKSELVLWQKIRGKQVLQVQFYRQKPIGPYIVDFYAPKASLVIEVDGSQHVEPKNKAYDDKRDFYLSTKKLTILRFDNLSVLKQTEAVLAVIYETVRAKLENPPTPFEKGG